MLPDLLDNQKLAKCKANWDLTRLIKNDNDRGVILMSLLPILRRRWREHGSTSGRRRGDLINDDRWWSRCGVIDVTPEMEPT